MSHYFPPIKHGEIPTCSHCGKTAELLDSLAENGRKPRCLDAPLAGLENIPSAAHAVGAGVAPQAASALAVGASLTTPSPSSRRRRSTAVQDSFKRKLARARARWNRNVDLCDICDHWCNKCEAAHVIDVANKSQFEMEAVTNRALPLSVNDSSNGLLLCPTCHAYFDAKPPGLRIDKQGKIIVSKQLLTANVTYKNVHKKVVWWIQHNALNDFPSGALLDFAYQLKPASGKRLRELSDESDELDDESNECDAASLKKSKKQAVGRIRKGVPKRATKKS